MNNHALKQRFESEVHLRVPSFTIHQDARIRWIFSGREGGISSGPYDSLNLATHVGDSSAAVMNNRNRLSQQIGLDNEQIVWMDQIHTTNFGVITPGRDLQIFPESSVQVGAYHGKIQEYSVGNTLISHTDALITAEQGIALAVVVADCVPVILYDPIKNIIVAVHAGRPGIAAGIIPLTIRAMSAYGALNTHIRVVMGPCAQKECYEIPKEIAEKFAHDVKDSINPQIMHRSELCPLSNTSWGSISIDLAATITLQLLSVGVSHIVQPAACTICDAAYFSYRRDGTTGRCAGIVWLA